MCPYAWGEPFGGHGCSKKIDADPEFGSAYRVRVATLFSYLGEGPLGEAAGGKFSNPVWQPLRDPFSIQFA